jgi:N-methylhydantoinase A
MLAVHTVGAGGGSIARLDAGGALKVGPESAGAEPGPAAYGRGGRAPTVTDADLVLGRLDAAHFLGGAAMLDRSRAEAVLAELGAAMSLPAVQAAEGVVAVADTVMARALKAISVERGHDPARFCLMPFGGAGGMHACAVARELGITRLFVPPSPGLVCAYGALVADHLHERVVARLEVLPSQLDASHLSAELAALDRSVEAALDADGVPGDRRARERWCTLRYRGQSFELAVPAAGDLVAGFHAAHAARYGYALRERAVELCSLRVRGIGRAAEVPAPQAPLEPGEPEVGSTTSRWDGRAWETPLYARRRLPDGARVAGPALIVEYSATTYLPPGARGEVSGGAIHVEL